MSVYNCVKISKDVAPIALKSKRNLFSQIIVDTQLYFLRPPHFKTLMDIHPVAWRYYLITIVKM